MICKNCNKEIRKVNDQQIDMAIKKSKSLLKKLVTKGNESELLVAKLSTALKPIEQRSVQDRNSQQKRILKKLEVVAKAAMVLSIETEKLQTLL